MPSDLAKKKAAKKKEAAKARQRSKKPEEASEEAEHPDTQQNGAETNGKKRTHSKHFSDQMCQSELVNILFHRYCKSDKGDG